MSNEVEAAVLTIEGDAGGDLNVRVARELLETARDTGVSLTGLDGLLRQITKTVLESALNAELDEHLGYGKGDREGRGTTNERNGTTPKTVSTDIGDVRIALRGLGDDMADFCDERGSIRDALWYCDMTTSPDGDVVAAEDRIAEIKSRYGPDDLVTRFITEAESELLAAVARTERRLAEVTNGQPR